MSTPAILFFSNLYPVTWDPNRAAFNYQQTQCMAGRAKMTYLVPVPFIEWFKHRIIKWQKQPDDVTTFPYFYTPGAGRRFYPFFLLLSVIICVVPLVKFASAQRVLASWAYPDGVCAAWLQRIFRFQLVIQCHGSDINVHIEQSDRRKQILSAFKQATCVVTKSQAMAKLINQYDNGICTKAVYNGVNVDRFTLKVNDTLDQKLCRLLFVGTIISTKGIFELVECIDTLRLSGHNIHLDVAGKGAEMERLQSCIYERGLSSHITVHGSLPHELIAEMMRNSDALILPSYREGIPNVMIEALASGVPALVTPVGGVPEILKDSVNGIILTSHLPDDIAEGISRFRSQQWDASAIRSSISHLNWENNVSTILDLFETN